MITELKDNEIFVFGSNLDGLHHGGAARYAYEKFGATWGIGSGFTGQCYAIPTMGGIDSLQLYIEQFLHVASLLPDKQFLLTRIGCGIAGYKDEDIAPLFKDAPNNVVLPEEWIHER